MLFEGLRAEVVTLTEHNRRLEHLLRELRRTMFGKKSEKLQRTTGHSRFLGKDDPSSVFAWFAPTGLPRPREWIVGHDGRAVALVE